MRKLMLAALFAVMSCRTALPPITLLFLKPKRPTSTSM
jgi:hypothetical protein